MLSFIIYKVFLKIQKSILTWVFSYDRINIIDLGEFMGIINKAKTVASDVYTDLTSHWKKPQKGNSVSYKEIVNYSVGGMGVNIIAYVAGMLSFGAANTLLGSAIGIRPMHLQYMATILSVLNVFLFMIRGYLVDNTRSKMGRFRPYLAFMGIPIVILTIVFVFLPFEHMSYIQKLFSTFAFGLMVAIFIPLVSDTYTELNSVISPNSQERTKIITISSLVFSFAPTVYLFLVPFLSEYTGGLTNIATYRYIVAPLGVLGAVLIMFVAFGTKERVVVSKTYVQKVGLIEGCISIFKNKYWWIRTVAGLVSFLEGACGVLFGWIFIYGSQNMVQYATLTTVLGSASGIAMLITPFLLNKLGNRKVLLYHNALNIVFIVCIMLVFRSTILYFFFLYLNTVVNQLSIVYNPSMHAEVKDYSQYISGKRMDFTFGAAGQILLPITIITGLFIPFIYEGMGLTFNYDILYDPVVRNSMFYILCVLSVVGAALNLIPFFFYRLSREKHKQIIWILNYRKAQDDYINGGLENISDSTIAEVVEGYNYIFEVKDKEFPILKEYKAKIKQARQLPKSTEEEKLIRKTSIKNAKVDLFKARGLIEDKLGINEFSLKELSKYDRNDVKLKIALSEIICKTDIMNMYGFNEKLTIPNEYRSDKNLTKLVEKMNKKVSKMVANMNKHYADGLNTNLYAELDSALAMPDTNNKEDYKLKKEAIKRAEKAIIKFERIMKPWLEADKLLKQYANRDFINDLIAVYPETRERLDEEQRLHNESEAQRIKERKEELALIKELKKQNKKDKKEKK